MIVKEQQAEQEVQRGLDGDEDGVLLYYKFVAIPEPPEIKSWLLGLSASLGLLGRIRVAPGGINVTVGGTTSALREHMRVVASHPLFGDIDFKLGTTPAPVHPRAAAECGFTTLSARLVKELVTLGLHPSAAPPSLSMAGQHVDAQSFHRILQDAAAGQHAAPSTDAGLAHGDEVNSKTPFSASGEKDFEGKRTDETFFTTSAHKKTVVMDVRNVYETRIGRMCPPKGVDTIYPMVRQYSDLPDWIDANEDLLRHKQILMYCTGGVRCEMASAYIRSKGSDYEDVLQLSGGIQRYLEAFPDGGYFAGKNFVFDHRLAVPSTNQDLLGSCLTCGAPFDDYSPRCRCSLCRLLVLVCKPCQLSSVKESGDPEYVCELCREEHRSLKSSKRVGERCSFSHRKLADEFESSNDPLSENGPGADEVREQKLRILCLHGFRQSASSLKGRLNALKKKLRHRVEFVFVDAPHEIQPGTLQGESDESDCKQTASDPGPSAARDHETPRTAGRKASNRRAWLTSPETAQGPHHPEGPDSSSRCIGIESHSDGRAPVSKCDTAEAHFNPPHEAPSPHKRTPEDSDSTSGPGPNIGTVPRTCPRITNHAPHNRPQFQSQTEGWPESWNHLKETFSSLGPFEGVLGFSQGAAVAAALCDLRDSVTGHRHGVDYQFVILCSGFRSRAPEHHRPPPSPPPSPSSSAGSESSSIDCPSLHIFGGQPGLDRQIGVGESEELASLFSPRHRMIVRHNAGHIVSTRAEHVLQYLQFLSQFEAPTRRGSRLS